VLQWLEVETSQTNELVEWRRGHAYCCCPSPGCCTQSPSPSIQCQRQHCRWCSSWTRSSTHWHGGERQTCRTSHTVSDSTWCSHSLTPLSTITITSTQVHNSLTCETRRQVKNITLLMDINCSVFWQAAKLRNEIVSMRV